MWTTPAPQERSKSCHGIHMDFTKAIAIFISGVLALSMIDTLMGVCSRRTHIMAYAGGPF